MYVLDNVLNAEELDGLRALARRLRFTGGAASAGGVARQVKANEELEFPPQDYQKFVRTIFDALMRHREFSRAVMPREISAPMVNRYSGGMTYGAHYDVPLMNTPAGPKIRADLAATLFISKPDEYDGGELCLTHHGREERIKLDAGQLFVYPAGTLHSVSAVSRGERLAVVFWIQSMVRDHDKRLMICDLDTVIGRIAKREPQSQDVRDLAGIFTNLVRMWAD